jgi:hypothetical protein
MPEKSVSRGKYNYNKHQKEKQNKILQYYRKSFKSQLAPVREPNRPKRTRKQHFQTTSSGMEKLTKTHALERDIEKEQEKEQKINLEKTEHLDITKSSIQKGGETQQQYVIMD